MISVMMLPIFMLLVMMLGAVAYKRALLEPIGSSFARMSLGALNYNPGGLVVPSGYHVPTIPYGPPAGSRATAEIVVISPTVANFNTKQFILRRNEADGSFTAVTFGFYVAPTAAPSLPIIGINLTGLTTQPQIATAIATALRTAGFNAPAPTSPNIFLTQPFPGSQGNDAFFSDFNAGGILVISRNGSQGLAINLYGNTLFGGIELAVPVRIGRIYGMAPVAPPLLNE